METGKELEAGIKRMKALGEKAVTANTGLQAEFIRLYFLAFDEKICGSCRDKIKNNFMSLINFKPNEKSKIMDERKFILKDKKLIDTTMSAVPPHGQYTNDNMTDKIAIDLLRKHKGYLKFFKLYPKDWESLLKKGEGKAFKVVDVKKDPARPETQPPPPGTVDSDPGPGKTTAPEITDAEKYKGDSSTNYVPSEAIPLIKDMTDSDVLLEFTKGEHNLKGKKKRMWVIKAVEKRVRQLEKAKK